MKTSLNIKNWNFISVENWRTDIQLKQTVQPYDTVVWLILDVNGTVSSPSPEYSIFFELRIFAGVNFVCAKKQTDRHTDRQTDGQTDRQTYRQTVRLN